MSLLKRVTNILTLKFEYIIHNFSTQWDQSSLKMTTTISPLKYTICLTVVLFCRWIQICNSSDNIWTYFYKDSSLTLLPILYIEFIQNATKIGMMSPFRNFHAIAFLSILFCLENYIFKFDKSYVQVFKDKVAFFFCAMLYQNHYFQTLE